MDERDCSKVRQIMARLNVNVNGIWGIADWPSLPIARCCRSRVAVNCPSRAIARYCSSGPYNHQTTPKQTHSDLNRPEHNHTKSSRTKSHQNHTIKHRLAPHKCTNHTKSHQNTPNRTKTNPLRPNQT